MDGTSSKNTRIMNDKWYEVESAEDVLANILSRLPVKSVSASKSVSKLWQKLISSPHFADLHLRRSRENPIYIVYPLMDVIMNVYLMGGNGEIIEMITLSGCENLPSVTMVCSFDGLVCCVNYPWDVKSNMTDVDRTDLEIRICNPVTREVFLLPKGSPSEQLPRVGVALGPKINDYKVFRFFFINLGPHSDHLRCEVYSSNLGSWRNLGIVPNSPMGSDNVFVDGKVYWFIASEEDPAIPGSILSVDMEENFKIICLPKEVTEHAFLVNLEGCLSLVAVYEEDEIVDIWVLQDCNESRWQKKCSDSLPFPNEECVDFVAAWKSELFFISTDHYYIYHVNDRIWRQLNLAGTIERNCPVAFAFTESLLSCRGRLESETEVNSSGPSGRRRR